MITINRVIVNRGNNKIDYTGNVPNPAENENINVIDLEKNVPTPITNELSTGNTTIKFTNIKNTPQKIKVKVVAGTYTTAFSAGGENVTYTLSRTGNLIKVLGTIKYLDANAAVGLTAGNHVILDFKRPGIDAKTDLPSDATIVKVTHTGKTGGYNTAGRNDFETDGSLVVAVNLTDATSMDKSVPREVKIAWEKDNAGNLIWETYILDFSEATLGTAA